MNKEDIKKKAIDTATDIAKDAITGAAKETVKTTVGGGLFSALAGPLLIKIIIGVSVAALVGGIGGFFVYDSQKTPTIADTKNVVEHVREISEFTTASYYEEFVVQESKIVAKESLFGFKKDQVDSVQNEIVIILKGKVRAGFDLSKMTEADLCAKSDTLLVQLPAPELFDVIINPSDYEIFIEEGKWSHDEIQAFQVQSKEQLRTHALQEDIIIKAKTEGKERLTNLFKTFGYKVIEVSVKE